MSALRALTGPTLATGFRLAGLEVDVVHNRSDVGPMIDSLVRTEDVGLLLVQQDLLDAIPEPQQRELDSLAAPILVPVPSPRWDPRTRGPDEYIVELLRRAIGYRVRLR